MSEQMLVCVTVAEAVADVVDGSHVRWCHVCAEEVWVSPSGLVLIENGEGLPVCMECVAGMPDSGDRPMQLAPGAIEELHEEGIDDVEIRDAMVLTQRDLARRRARRY